MNQEWLEQLAQELRAADGRREGREIAARQPKGDTFSSDSLGQPYVETPWVPDQRETSEENLNSGRSYSVHP